MKAVMVWYDSLIRKMLPAYGCDWVHTPNFERLAERSVTFDNCYAGSMPCMPARKELHTGRYSFLHRGWGPLEPFDDSVPELLKLNGVHTHLATDHVQYWDDGGAAYACRYSTFEFFRGQEGDPWKGLVGDPGGPEDLRNLQGQQWRQDRVNRQYLQDEADHPQTLTFDAGLEFIRRNRDEDNWFVHIEAFDPHEPFFSYDQYKKQYPHTYDGPRFDWPDYARVTESDDAAAHARLEYAALLTMCDANLGRVLDAMDEYELWDDTMVIVCTDHGYLLGEHGWWAKVVQPWYDETIHTPLFIWDPRCGARGEHRQSLVQTIDFGPTLLDFFGMDLQPDMQGVPLRATIADDTPVREYGLFGMYGAHVCVTDGRYVYMRACADARNKPLYEYTLMPTEMFARFTVERLREAELAEPFTFMKGVRPLRVPGQPFNLINPWGFGSLLYDLATDPAQDTPLVDDDVELRLAQKMVDLMRWNDAPAEQFERMGLPVTGDVGPEHLLVRKQWHLVEASLAPLPPESDFPAGEWSVATPLTALLLDPSAREIVGRHAPALAADDVPDRLRSLSPFQIAEMGPGLLSLGQLTAIAGDLSSAVPR